MSVCELDDNKCSEKKAADHFLCFTILMGASLAKENKTIVIDICD